MLKNLLLFFRIVDEIYTPAPIVRGEKSVKDPVIPKETPISEENQVTASKLKIMPVSTKKIVKLEEHTKDYKEYCLEKTSNQHMMKTSDYKVIDRNDSTETFFIQDDAFITHNEHKMLRIESKFFVKYIQQEYNPITQINENAYD